MTYIYISILLGQMLVALRQPSINRTLPPINLDRYVSWSLIKFGRTFVVIKFIDLP